MAYVAKPHPYNSYYDGGNDYAMYGHANASPMRHQQPPPDMYMQQQQQQQQQASQQPMRQSTMNPNAAAFMPRNQYEIRGPPLAPAGYNPFGYNTPTVSRVTEPSSNRGIQSNLILTTASPTCLCLLSLNNFPVTTFP